MEYDSKIESIYQSNSEIKKHFNLKVLEVNGKPFFYLGIREDSSGKALEPIIVILDDVFTQAAKNGFMNFVFSFKEVTYFGDLGYSLVVGFSGWVMDRGGEFILIEVQPKQMEIIKILGVDELWPFYNSEEEFLEAMNK
jgi:anti-anti-sigma regulatory factor